MAETAQAVDTTRESGPLPSPRARRRYAIVLASLIVLAVVFGAGLLVWDNPVPFGTAGFWKVAELRGTSIIVMGVVAVCQATATVSFQTVTNNRIVTPSIMGFESLYVAVQTSSVYFLGAAGILAVQGRIQFVLQIGAHGRLLAALYGWLLSGRFGSIHVMLLIGIVIGGGLGSVSAFMQRLLTPSEFDVLTARLFGNVSNANPDDLPVAIPLCIAAAVAALAAVATAERRGARAQREHSARHQAQV